MRGPLGSMAARTIPLPGFSALAVILALCGSRPTLGQTVEDPIADELSLHRAVLEKEQNRWDLTPDGAASPSAEDVPDWSGPGARTDRAFFPMPGQGSAPARGSRRATE